jgi:metal-responsive CopG/Arc/MetJ family transcriptional regulator
LSCPICPIERINITLPHRVLRRLDDMARTTGESRSGLVARLTVASSTKDVATRVKRRA